MVFSDRGRGVARLRRYVVVDGRIQPSRVIGRTVDLDGDRAAKRSR